MELQDNLLGLAVKIGRQNKGLSQESLAEMLDISPTHLKHIESGHRNPSAELLFRIARILNISLDAVVFPERSLPDIVSKQVTLLLEDCDEEQIKVMLATMNAIKNSTKKDSKK